MKTATKQAMQSAIERLKQGAGLLPVWARELKIRRLERAIVIKKN